MPSVGFEPTIPAGERPQTYALDRAGTGTGRQKKNDRRRPCPDSAGHVTSCAARTVALSLPTSQGARRYFLHSYSSGTQTATWPHVVQKWRQVGTYTLRLLDSWTKSLWRRGGLQSRYGSDGDEICLPSGIEPWSFLPVACHGS